MNDRAHCYSHYPKRAWYGLRTHRLWYLVNSTDMQRTFCYITGIDEGTTPRGCFVLNTLRPRQNGRYFADDIFKCIFFNENIWISLQISLKFVPKVQITNISALVQRMVWRRGILQCCSFLYIVSFCDLLFTMTGICEISPNKRNLAKFRASIFRNAKLGSSKSLMASHLGMEL